MEITTPVSLQKVARPGSSFDCDANQFDGLLGVRSLGDRNLRFDASDFSPDESTKDSYPDRPLPTLASTPVPWQPDKQERLMRIMDQQQRLYEAELSVRKQAEEMLMLIDYQQQIALAVRDPMHSEGQ